jgi:hypothetical protein
MSLGLSVSGSSQKQHVFSGGGQLGKLIESQAGSLSGDNSISGGLGEAQGGDSESFWKVEESDVVGDGADDGDDAVKFVSAFGQGDSVLAEESGNA